jgi:hypothetical protein
VLDLFIASARGLVLTALEHRQLAEMRAGRRAEYVVWFDMLAGDSRQLVDTRVLNDPRVTNFYDPKKAIGSWFSERLDGEKGIVWDAYFLYGSDASWAAEPGPLLSSGRTVIGSSADLATAFRTLG